MRLKPKIAKKTENTTRNKEWGKVERGKVLTSEAMVDHSQHNLRREIVSEKFNSMT